jgi:hypothetical protein
MSTPPATRKSADRVASFNHLIGSGEELWRDREIERFGGLQIQDKSKPMGLIERGAAHWFTFEQCRSLMCHGPVKLYKIDRINHQPA